MKSIKRPSIYDLGIELLEVSFVQKILAIAAPFLFIFLYFVSYYFEWFVISFISLILLSFFSFGSVSHDLVHQAYKLPPRLNFFLLFLIELLCLRSGTAYRYVHLKHHQLFPDSRDVEGKAAFLNAFYALLYGMVFQPIIWFETFKKKPTHRGLLLLEVIVGLLVIVTAILSYPHWNAMVIYCSVMYAGSWIIPFMTSYLPHSIKGTEEVDFTKRFRGRFLSIIAFDHLYHLEHHMYPAVPHQNWKELAGRLDPYLDSKDKKPIKIIG